MGFIVFEVIFCIAQRIICILFFGEPGTSSRILPERREMSLKYRDIEAWS